MGKKGQVYLGIVLALFIWASGIMFIPYFTDMIDAQRIDLQCTTSSIAGYIKMMCLVTDAWIPYFIYALLVLALGLIVGGLTG